MVRLLVAAIAAVLSYSSSAVAADAVPDPTFGDDGFVLFDPGLAPEPSAVQFSGLAVQADGRIVAAGHARFGTGPGAETRFYVARFMADGAPDPTFAIGGRKHIDFPNPQGLPSFHGDVATDVAIAPDGGIVVAGFVQRVATAQDAQSRGQSRYVRHVALARLLPDGELDPGFGQGGTLVDADLAVLGSSNPFEPPEQRPVANAAAHGVVITGGTVPRIAIVGSVQSIRFEDDRARQSRPIQLIALYDQDGKRVDARGFDPLEDARNVESAANDVILEGTDFVVAGYVTQKIGDVERDLFSVTRLDAELGVDDSTTSGRPFYRTPAGRFNRRQSTVDLGRGIDARANGIARDRSGRYLLAGTAAFFDADLEAVGEGFTFGIAYVVDRKSRLAVARLGHNGGIDRTFSGNGYDLPRLPGSATAQAVAVQPDGRILVAGTGRLETRRYLALLRYRSDGTLDSTFSGDGRLLMYVDGTRSSALAALHQAGDRALLAGGATTRSGKPRFLLGRVARPPRTVNCGSLLGCPQLLLRAPQSGNRPTLVITGELPACSGDKLRCHSLQLLVRRKGQPESKARTVPLGAQAFGTFRLTWDLVAGGKRIDPEQYAFILRVLRNSRPVKGGKVSITPIPIPRET